NSAEEIDQILALPVSEDKNKKQDTDDDDNSDIPVPTLKRKKSSTTSKISQSAELINYKREIDPYDIDSFKHFKGNLIDFWESTSGIGPELARVAIRIHEMQQLHIAAPIPNNEDKEFEPDGDELYQVSDKDSNEINSKDNNEVIIKEEEQRWDQLIQEWINLEIQENQFDNQDDQIFILSE
ncbi:10116_t:CDS:2, partial [Cetraspora pellucida]